MPYRRLPNTDAARLKALHNALTKGEEIPPFKLAFPQSLYYRIQSFLPRFENMLNDYKQKKQQLSKQTKKLQEYYRKAKMFLTHFIQVTSFSIQRGELPSATLKYLGLESINTFPAIQTYDDLLKWGKIILEGEERRTAEGYYPITNPTAAVVKVRYEQFLDAYYSQRIHIKSRNSAHEKIIYYRQQADKLISQLWDNIEASFKDMPDNMKRKEAAEYGVVYVYRSNETKHVNFL